MKEVTLADLQETVQDKSAFGRLEDYLTICRAFLAFVKKVRPTRIVSPSRPNYIFFQYDAAYGHKITRPLNTDLFVESAKGFTAAFERFVVFLGDLKRYQEKAITRKGNEQLVKSRAINKVIYTAQQAIGSIGDSFDNPNQSRKRVGQLFENLVKLIIQEVGAECEPRTINIPIPGYPGHAMSYQLDLVFSRDKAVITSETKFIHESEIVGSVKTTSKDRIDKVFLDKYLLTKLLGRNIPVIAVFLHDVQRARKGSSMFGINSTFKTNHFLGYTMALSRLDGVYYVDPLSVTSMNEELREQIHDFQRFLTADLWTLSG